MRNSVRIARIGLMAAYMAAPVAGRAASVDMTTLNPIYDPTYWSEAATTNSLTITRTIAPMSGDGPHNILSLGNADYVMTVTVSVTGVGLIGGTPFIDTPSYYEGVTTLVGDLTDTSLYPQPHVDHYFPNGPITLRLSRIGDVFTGAYESGSSFVTLFSFADPGMLGPSNIDLSANYYPPGATDPGQVVYSNLDVSFTPEPGTWLFMASGVSLLGALARRRRAARPIG
jgi:hypothetical protein